MKKKMVALMREKMKRSMQARLLPWIRRRIMKLRLMPLMATRMETVRRI